MSQEASSNSSVNRDFWNSRASTYNTTNATLAKAVTQAIQDNASWIGIPSSGKVLDFACGTGTVSMAIANSNPSLTFRGIDVSNQMITQYHERFNSIDGIDAAAVEVDITSNKAFQPDSPISGPDWLGFDLAVVASSLHHIDKPELVVARLVERLQVGGVLCVIDWVDDGTNDHKHQHHHGHKHKHGQESRHKEDQESLLKQHGVAHRHGFTEEQIASLMKDAGLQDFGYCQVEGMLQFGPFERKIFIARANKSPISKLGLTKATSWNLMH